MYENKVHLRGNLGADVEVAFYDDGGKRVTGRLATSEFGKDRDGNRTERTQWHSLRFIGKRGDEWRCETLKKGTNISLWGKIEYREGEDKEGRKTRWTDIVVFDYDWKYGLPKGQDQSASQREMDVGGQKEKAPDPNTTGGDDLPF